MTTSDLPGDLTGGNPLFRWLNRLKRAISRRTLLPGLGYKLRQHENGVALEIIPGGGGGPPVIQIKRFLITAIPGPNSSHIIGREWDGNPAPPANGTVGADVLISKHGHMKSTLGGEVIDGITFTYIYTDANNRVANDGTNIQNEVAYPRYKVGDFVMAARVANDTGDWLGSFDNPVQWTELTPRVWARRFSG